MAIYTINGRTLNSVFDINGNPVVSNDSKSVGYVVAPEYKTINDQPYTYRLVWHDEFDEADIDKSFWNDVHFISRVTNRYQAWTDYYLNDGILHLRLKKDAPNRYLSDDNRDASITAIQTGQVNRLHLINPNYHDVNPFWGLLTQEGYYECRFKVFKATGGAHTSWWCVGIQDGMYKESPRAEIDITEILARNTKALPHGVHKWQDSETTEAYTTTNTNVDFAEDFHVVGFLWENGIMKWYVDGALVDTKNINTPQYPMMHFLAAYKTRSGTGWTGEADPTLSTKDVEFQVDYLRIYKKATNVSSGEVTIDHYGAINIDGANSDMSIDMDRGCPLCFPSYVYVYWSDGTRTEHWTKWQAVQETYNTKMTNQQSFEWAGYVYGIGLEVVANVNY